MSPTSYRTAPPRAVIGRLPHGGEADNFEPPVYALAVILAFVIVAAVALVASLAFTAVRVGGAALELRKAVRLSHNTRLEALFALDAAHERLAADVAHTTERRAALDAQLAQLARARNMLGLLAEAAGEALRLVRLPR